MWAPAKFQVLADGRAHFSHGPIDLVIGAEGDSGCVAAGIDRAWNRFGRILEELVAELPALRAPCRLGRTFDGPVARRMQAAAEPFAASEFLTPMAAVAGAVADEICDVISAAGVIEKIHVNNGGDISVHLGGDMSMRIGLVPDLVVESGAVALQGQVTLRAADRIGGIATSGRHGRSLSLGIADAVTVLAESAAAADAAATLIANGVNTESGRISRAPACELDPDSDLGERLVTVDVGTLTSGEVGFALDQGEAVANGYVSAGLIRAAALYLGGDVRLAGNVEAQLVQQEECAWT